ncbi:PHP domain-containing protein [Pseudomonadota bacterium]
MSLTIDLHSHSTASDGTLSPRELLQHACRSGLETLALTDHDTIDGIAEAAAEAESIGLGFIPGVEVSVTWNKQVVHVVGLNVDPECPVLQKGLLGQQAFRGWRAEEMGRRLDKAGIPGAYEGAKALSNGHLIGRTHFARFLVEHGHAKDVRKVFKHFLTSGKPGHVPGQWASLDEAVAWIRAAGGSAVIAHPARYPFTRTKLRRLLGEFVDAGGDGLEVVSGSHSRDDNFTMARHAKDFGLCSSAGSDYHGPENPWFELGRLPELPDGCRPIWRSWTASTPARAVGA